MDVLQTGMSLWSHPVTAYLLESRHEIWAILERLLFSVGLILAALAALRAVGRITSILEVLSVWKDLRDPTHGLRPTLERLEELRPMLAELRENLPGLAQQVAMADKLQNLVASINLTLATTNNQLIAIQRDLGDQVEAEAGADEAPADEPPVDIAAIPPPAAVVDQRWERLRDAWRDARNFIETLVAQATPEQQQELSKLARYDYLPVMQKLQEFGLANSQATGAAKDMRNRFNSYKRRKAQITPAVLEHFFSLAARLRANAGVGADAAPLSDGGAPLAAASPERH